MKSLIFTLIFLGSGFSALVAWGCYIMNLISPNDKIAMDVSIYMAITITVISIVSGILMNFFIPNENEKPSKLNND